MEELQLVQDLSQLNESYLRITERNQSNVKSKQSSASVSRSGQSRRILST